MMVDPPLIPFTRDGQPVVFGGWDGDGRDDAAGLEVVRHVAKVKKGSLLIPQPKVRPMLRAPWRLEFEVTIWRLDTKVTPSLVADWFVKGGLLIGFGTFRPQHGRFAATVTTASH